jgi:hypothetical protein
VILHGVFFEQDLEIYWIDRMDWGIFFKMGFQNPRYFPKVPDFPKVGVLSKSSGLSKNGDTFQKFS